MDVLQIWNSRIAHWASKGLTGVDLYLALAADHELPAEFSPGELSEITGMALSSVKKRRVRGQAPNFVRLGARTVRYMRSDVCHGLASRYVQQEAA